MRTKVCSKCRCSKPVSEFYRNGTSKTGRQNYTPKCKECFSESRRDLEAENRRSSEEAKSAADAKVNAILSRNSAEYNEKYISYKASRQKYIVQMDGNYYGHFYTIEGARAKKAELLESRELRKLESEIEELENQLVLKRKRLEELR